MVYKIDPASDRQFIEEFRLNPIGAHSPGLMRVLTVMRVDPTGNQTILVCKESFVSPLSGSSDVIPVSEARLRVLRFVSPFNGSRDVIPTSKLELSFWRLVNPFSGSRDVMPVLLTESSERFVRPSRGTREVILAS
jgi:hypothetical protein